MKYCTCGHNLASHIPYCISGPWNMVICDCNEFKPSFEAVIEDISNNVDYLIEITCPRCGQTLDSNHCKLICSKCGYYKGCSDF